MGRSLSNHHVVLIKVSGAGIKKRGVGKGAKRIRSEKLRENQYKKAYAECPFNKKVEYNENSNVE